MTSGAVILCRYNSSRLPGKILKDIHGKTALEHTYDRIAKIYDPTSIVIATSTEKTDDPIVQFCEERNWKLFRGDLNNVAKRFYDAARSLNVDYGLRVNGDNIFVDLESLEKMRQISESGQYDFVSNVKDRTYPKGMSIEFVKLEHYDGVLKRIEADTHYQEHVTLCLYENDWSQSFFQYNEKFPALKGINLALDTPEDFERIVKMITLLGEKYKNYSLADIDSVYEQLER